MLIEKKYNIYSKYPGLKEDFISSIDGKNNTVISYARILSKTGQFEEKLNKDLSEFNFDELDKLMGFLNASSMSSLQTQHNVIKQYVQYAINKGYGNPLKINFAEMLRIKDFDKYINRIKYTKKIISREDILDIAESSDLYGGNAQDYCSIILIYNGVWGRNLEELINLKREDIDEKNNTLTLTSNNGVKRTIEIDQEWMKYILYASEETEYTNIDEDDDKLKYHTHELIDTQYVLKKIKRGNLNLSKITPQQIRIRINKVRKFWGNEYINPRSILNSGMLDFTKKYMGNLNKGILNLERNDYEYIAERFGIGSKNYFSVKQFLIKNLDNLG